jgi:hypothetical protein
MIAGEASRDTKISKYFTMRSLPHKDALKARFG